MNPEVGNEVEVEDGGGTDILGGDVQSGTHQSQTEIGDGNEDGLAGAEDSAGRLEVADTEPLGQTGLGLPLLATLSRAGVEEHVHLPSEKLVEDELDELRSRSILDELSNVNTANDKGPGGLGLSGGDKGHVELHVSMEAVVAVVRVLPAEVGDHQERVEGPSGDIVDLAVEREGTVAALVSQDPDAGAEESLDEAVDHPGSDAEGRVGDAGDVCEGGPDEGRNHGKIAEDIVVGCEERGLEAVRGDGILDGLDVGELRLGGGLKSDLRGSRVRTTRDQSTELDRLTLRGSSTTTVVAVRCLVAIVPLCLGGRSEGRENAQQSIDQSLEGRGQHRV